MVTDLSAQRKVLLCYGKTPYTPGRYLEQGFRRIGVSVDSRDGFVDFSKLPNEEYQAIVFVESPSRPAIRVKAIQKARSPKFFWIHHGEHRWKTNLKLCQTYQTDYLLMAHSLHLSEETSIPVRFFPFALDQRIFHGQKPITDRANDLGFVGDLDNKFHRQRNESLRILKDRFSASRHLLFAQNYYLQDLANIYRNTKVVFNQSADVHRAINMRLFEGMGCGSLVISEMVPGQERLFTDGEHYVVFKSTGDLIEKVEYYLAHPREAQTIASAGQQLLLAKHTYEDRAKEILKLCS